ncbi:MAG: hypothetical protein Q4F67_14830 [Propionibacteriaceae bacterium]|nr:hypothetical protein [Propionibacteriaceae bacterium]
MSASDPRECVVRILAALVAAAALVLSACAGGPEPPIVETATPTPWPGETAAVEPTESPSPSVEELTREAEETYRTLVLEMARLEEAGGSDEPTQALKDLAGTKYREVLVQALSDQRAEGYEVGGPDPIVEVVSAPGGEFDNIDPRLTLEACEDHTLRWYRDETGTHPAPLVRKTAYFGYEEGALKVVGALATVVEECEP